MLPMGGDPNGSPLVFLTIFIFFFAKVTILFMEVIGMMFWKIREVFLEEDECIIIYK